MFRSPRPADPPPDVPDAGDAPRAASPFDVAGALAVRRILEALKLRRAVLTVQLQGRDAPFVTQVLAVDEATLVLDAPARAEHRRLMLAAPGARLEGRDGQVPVAFAIPAPREHAFEGLPALVVPLPARVQRFQKRHHYRVHVPRGTAAFCWLPADGGRVRARIVDLSCSGVALVADGTTLDAWPDGEARGPCELRLPGHPPLAVHLEAVRTMRAPGGPGRVLACRFARIDGRTQQAVQRFVDDLQRDALRRR